MHLRNSVNGTNVPVVNGIVVLCVAQCDDSAVMKVVAPSAFEVCSVFQDVFGKSAFSRAFNSHRSWGFPER